MFLLGLIKRRDLFHLAFERDKVSRPLFARSSGSLIELQQSIHVASGVVTDLLVSALRRIQMRVCQEVSFDRSIVELGASE